MHTLLIGSLIIALGINSLLFLIAFKFKSDKLTDISYSLTFIAIALFDFSHASGNARYNLIILLMVLIWACRTGGFLLYRVIKKGKDRRFDGMREKFISFGKFWLGQGITGWVLLLPMTFICSQPTSWHTVSLMGLGIWLLGFVIESLADYQKNKFSSRDANRGIWIDEGIWHFSRHPNYFGEILIWLGVYVYALPQLSDMEKVIAILSPVLISLVLLLVSGVPILEKNADEKWGKLPAYRAYKRSTSLLVPLPKKSNIQKNPGKA